MNPQLKSICFQPYKINLQIYKINQEEKVFYMLPKFSYIQYYTICFWKLWNFKAAKKYTREVQVPQNCNWLHEWTYLDTLYVGAASSLYNNMK